MTNQELVNQNDEQLLNVFEVEELENRLEFAWVSEVKVGFEVETPVGKATVETTIPIR